MAKWERHRKELPNMRTIPFTIFFVLFVTLFAVSDVMGGPNPDRGIQLIEANRHFSVYQGNSVFKIPCYADDVKAEKALGGGTISLYSAKGGHASFQLAIVAKKEQELLVSSIDFTDLTHTGDPEERVLRENIRAHVVGYINDKDPDVLFPAGEFKKVLKDRFLTFWITVKAPEEIAHGKYRGTIKIITNRGSSNIPLTLNVWNFSLPSRISVQPMLFAVDPFQIAIYHDVNFLGDRFDTGHGGLHIIGLK